MNFQELLEYNLISIGGYRVTPFHIFEIIILVAISWILVFLVRKVIKRQIKSKRFDEGRGAAFFQIIK